MLNALCNSCKPRLHNGVKYCTKCRRYIRPQGTQENSNTVHFFEKTYPNQRTKHLINVFKFVASAWSGAYNHGHKKALNSTHKCWQKRTRPPQHIKDIWHTIKTTVRNLIKSWRKESVGLIARRPICAMRSPALARSTRSRVALAPRPSPYTKTIENMSLWDSPTRDRDAPSVCTPSSLKPS